VTSFAYLSVCAGPVRQYSARNLGANKTEDVDEEVMIGVCVKSVKKEKERERMRYAASEGIEI
jgi:hypothetical protein